MQSFLHRAAGVLLIGLVTACGGNSPSPQAAACDSGTLWANIALLSGARIPDNEPQGLLLVWDNQNCQLQTVSSVRLEVCLKHDKPQDLAWTVSAPSATAAVSVGAHSAWNETGSPCAQNEGRLQSLDALAALPASGHLRGPWTLGVRDRQQGDEGAVLQWRLLIGGTN